MSSLSLALPGACPFSPSLSVLLDSVSTSWGQEQLLLWASQPPFSPGMWCSPPAHPSLLQETLGKGIPPQLRTPHPTGPRLEHLWDFGGC